MKMLTDFTVTESVEETNTLTGKIIGLSINFNMKILKEGIRRFRI